MRTLRTFLSSAAASAAFLVSANAGAQTPVKITYVPHSLTEASIADGPWTLHQMVGRNSHDASGILPDISTPYNQPTTAYGTPYKNYCVGGRVQTAQGVNPTQPYYFPFVRKNGEYLDQVLYAFLVTIIAALTLGLMGIAFSTLLRRSLAATVAAYVGAFVLMFGTLGYGLVLPTEIDSNASKAPAPPAVTYLSPIIPLFWIATNAPPYSTYGIRYGNGIQYQNGGGSFCQPGPGGGTICSSTVGSVPITIGPNGKGLVQVQPQTGNAIPSGFFEGWQPWQATIVMQLGICLLALLASAFLLPPVRRFPWRRWRRPIEQPA